MVKQPCSSKNNFGQAMEDLMNERGITNERLALLMNSTPEVVVSFKRGTSRPSTDQLIAISVGLKINPFDLLRLSLSKSKYFRGYVWLASWDCPASMIFAKIPRQGFFAFYQMVSYSYRNIRIYWHKNNKKFDIGKVRIPMSATRRGIRKNSVRAMVTRGYNSTPPCFSLLRLQTNP